MFETSDGARVLAITEAQMREVDRIAIEETGPNLHQMMENAGRNLALHAVEMIGADWKSARIVILAGVGGNGGGGICAGRHLANRAANVVVCVAAPDRITGVPQQQLRVYRSARGAEVGWEDIDRESPALIIDALIGYSLRGAPRGVPLTLIEWANAASVPVLSLDVPSGVDSTTGEAPGAFITAAQTMTLALPKTGLLPDRTGELWLADIGIPRETYERAGIAYESPFAECFRVQLEAATS
jgi:NAD(P)H-hydrate epimerase